MHTRPPPQLSLAPLAALRPTQMTVGRREVAEKRAEWRQLTQPALRQALDSHWFPAVAGPRGKTYIVDHHHLGLALLEEGVEQVRLMILQDLSWLEPATFWQVMEHHRWVHPVDADGIRRDYADLPKKLVGLRDDPYRSLAGHLRHAGGFAKDATPFSEFLWADFLRTRIPRRQIDKHYAAALAEARALAHAHEARYLPGWVRADDA